jgi:hypothetical protein
MNIACRVACLCSVAVGCAEIAETSSVEQAGTHVTNGVDLTTAVLAPWATPVHLGGLPITSYEVTYDRGTSLAVRDTFYVALLASDAKVQMRVDAVDGEEVALSYPGPDGKLYPICPDGRPAIAVRGRFGVAADRDGELLDVGRVAGTADRVTFVCPGSPAGRCIEEGYRDSPYLDACIRMIRGDYTGSGRALAVAGTAIDVVDALRIRTEYQTSWRRDAEWGPAGAICLAPDSPMVGKVAVPVKSECAKGPGAYLASRTSR